MICFFDIDGTLVDFGKTDLIPSTRLALTKARKAGHRLLICTGRSVTQVPAWLIAEGFDGIVASAGAHIIYHNKEIYFHAMPPEFVRRTVCLFSEHRIPYMLQGKKQNYAAESLLNKLMASLAEKGDFDADQIEKLLGGFVHTGDDPAADIAASNDAILSMVYEKSPFDHEMMQEKLGPDLHITPPSFNKPDAYSGEITQAGITKATGIQTVMDHLGAPRKETAAFGDGFNDIEMLRFAGTGIAMGNAPDEVKRFADLVTAPLQADGLYQAMQQLNLL